MAISVRASEGEQLGGYCNNPGEKLGLLEHILVVLRDRGLGGREKKIMVVA